MESPNAVGLGSFDVCTPESLVWYSGVSILDFQQPLEYQFSLRHCVDRKVVGANMSWCK